MPDTDHTDDTKKRKEPSGRPLTEEAWIEEMNRYDRLSQYAKRRRQEEMDAGRSDEIV